MTKRDTVVQVRLRRKDIATAMLFLSKRGVPTRSLGHIVQQVFEGAVASVIAEGVSPVKSTEEAAQLLSHFSTKGNPQGKLFKAFAINIMNEEEHCGMDPVKQDIIRQREEKDSAQLEAQKAILDSMGLLK